MSFKPSSDPPEWPISTQCSKKVFPEPDLANMESVHTEKLLLVFRLQKPIPKQSVQPVYESLNNIISPATSLKELEEEAERFSRLLKKRKSIISIENASSNKSNTSVGGGKNGKKSQSSVSSSNVIAMRILKAWNIVYKATAESPLAHKVYGQMEKLKYRILAVFLLDAILVVGVIITIFLGTNRVVPTIGVYNVIHILFGFVTAQAVIANLQMAREISNATIASSLVTGRAKLTEVTMDPRNRHPRNGRFTRRLTLLFAFLFEAIMIWLSLSLEWTPTPSLLGTYGCIPATYPTPVFPLKNIGNYLQGDVEFAEIYNYALPLADGAIGGRNT